MAPVSEFTRDGVTFTLSAAREVVDFLDGIPCVVLTGSSDSVRVTAISPAEGTRSSSIISAAVVNPRTNNRQGFDEDANRWDTTHRYVPASDAALIGNHSSLIKAVSRSDPLAAPSTNNREIYIEKYVAVYFRDSAPATNEICPPLFGYDGSTARPTATVDVAAVKAALPTLSEADLVDSSDTSVTAPSAADIAAKYCKLDLARVSFGNFQYQDLTPVGMTHREGYGEYMAGTTGAALCKIVSADTADAVDDLIIWTAHKAHQLYHGRHALGADSTLDPNGGHTQGWMGPVVAGLSFSGQSSLIQNVRSVLRTNELTPFYWTQDLVDGLAPHDTNPTTQDSTNVILARRKEITAIDTGAGTVTCGNMSTTFEDENNYEGGLLREDGGSITWPITDYTQGSLRFTLDTSTNDLSSLQVGDDVYVQLAYSRSAGDVDWRISDDNFPNRIGTENAEYRQIQSWTGAWVALMALGLKDELNHDPYFDYVVAANAADTPSAGHDWPTVWDSWQDGLAPNNTPVPYQQAMYLKHSAALLDAGGDTPIGGDEPQGVTAVTLTAPDPMSLRFLKWKADQFKTNKDRDPGGRTLYYITDTGTPGDGDGTSGSPKVCANLLDIRAVIAAEGDDTEYLFRSGGVWGPSDEASGDGSINPNNLNNIGFGAYGIGPRPILHGMFTIEAAFGTGTGSPNVSQTVDLSNAGLGLRGTSDIDPIVCHLPNGMTDEDIAAAQVYERVSSISAEGQFTWNQSTETLVIRYRTGHDATNTWITSAFDGIITASTTGGGASSTQYMRVRDLVLRGCAGQNSHCINFASRGGFGRIENVRADLASEHCIAWDGNAGSQGYTLSVERIEGGWARSLGAGTDFIVAYNADGNQFFYARDMRVYGGRVETSVNSGDTYRAYFMHTDGSSSIGGCLIDGVDCLDTDWQTVGYINNTPGTGNIESGWDPRTASVFLCNEKYRGSALETKNFGFLLAPGRCWRINLDLEATHNASAQSYLIFAEVSGTKIDGVMLNNRVKVTSTTSNTAPNMAIFNDGFEGLAINCLFDVDGPSGRRLRSVFDIGVTSPSTDRTGIWRNNVLINRMSPGSASNVMQLDAGDANNIVYGFKQSDLDANSPDNVTSVIDAAFEVSSDLVYPRTATADYGYTVQYDINENARPSVIAIGPYDTGTDPGLSRLSGGGGRFSRRRL